MRPIVKVSIGIPFYNAGNDFKQAISSVLQQSYSNFELILLNDGSSDNSLDIAQSFSDPRIRVISDGVNKGLPSRLNELINLSRGDFIARMDADDLISVNRIQQQVEFLVANPDLDLVSTGICSITNDNRVVGYREAIQKNNTCVSVSNTVFGKANIAHATIMARKAWYLRNRYNEQAKLMEDYQLWIDAAIKRDLAVGYIKTPLYFYREESSTSSKKAINAYVNQYLLVYSNYFDKLGFIEKLKFSLLTLVKVSTVYVLNIFSFTEFLVKIRNKNTEQDEKTLQKLQNELDVIRYKN